MTESAQVLKIKGEIRDLRKDMEHGKDMNDMQFKSISERFDRTDQAIDEIAGSFKTYLAEQKADEKAARVRKIGYFSTAAFMILNQIILGVVVVIKGGLGG